MSTRRKGIPQHIAITALIALAVLVAMAILVDRTFFDSSAGPRQGIGSGVAAWQTRVVPAFAAVELAGANNVVVQVGPRQSVVVHADRNLLRRVTTRVRSRVLVIGTTPGNVRAKSPMFVAVSLPSLDALTLTGAGNVSVTGISSSRVSLALPGSGNIDAGGTTKHLDVKISGHGTARLRQLVARDANAAISGDGTIMLTATRSLSARISGSGTLLYAGNPRRVVPTITGSGTIAPE